MAARGKCAAATLCGSGLAKVGFPYPLVRSKNSNDSREVFQGGRMPARVTTGSVILAVLGAPYLARATDRTLRFQLAVASCPES
jgi:hypothetical protein